MASEEDTFELDLDGDYEDPDALKIPSQMDGTADDEEDLDDASDDEVTITVDGPSSASQAVLEEEPSSQYRDFREEDATDDPATLPPKYTKRKSPADDRPLDHNATHAITLSELHWYTTEDDIRGWINQAGCEDELKQITFSEHKVNGKSKGQAYVEFFSPQASTAVKHKIDSLGSSDQPPSTRKFTASYSNDTYNPFKAQTKDLPDRDRDDRRGYSTTYAGQDNYHSGSRGGRGGGFRGGRGYNSGSYSSNRGFSGGYGGNQGMNNFRSGGFGRGGGRGGMGMGMGAMPMGGMMPMMNPMMGMGGFQNFNPGMFNPMGANGTGWNPQLGSNKRQRQE